MDGRGITSDRISIVIMFFAIGEASGKISIGAVGDRLPFQWIYVMAVSALVEIVALSFMITVHTFTQMLALSISKLNLKERYTLVISTDYQING